VLLKHTGTYVFDYQTQDKLYQDLHQMALSNQAAAQPQIVDTSATPVAAPEVAVEATVIASSRKKTKQETATVE
jgi:hypothetical protein